MLALQQYFVFSEPEAVVSVSSGVGGVRGWTWVSDRIHENTCNSLSCPYFTCRLSDVGFDYWGHNRSVSRSGLLLQMGMSLISGAWAKKEIEKEQMGKMDKNEEEEYTRWIMGMNTRGKERK